YRRVSAAARLWDRYLGDPPAPATGTPPPDPGAAVDAALDVHARARVLAEVLAEEHDLPVRFFWQPRRGGWPAEVLDRLPPEVTDLSGVFDDLPEDSVYIDADVHTDEDGARRLAEALWAEVAADLEE